MQRKRHQPPTLADVLSEVARRAGSEPLLRARAEVAVREALGPILAPRLHGVRREGRAWVLDIEGTGEAAAVARLAPEVLALLRSALRADAPDSLRVTSTAPRAGDRFPTSGDAAEENLANVGPLTRQALARVGDSALRERLERFAQRRSPGASREVTGLVREGDPS